MVTGGLALVDGVECYRIEDVDEMEPFLTTVVSDTDLWMFASSTGALTAGRVDADHAVFPYCTDDKLHRAAGLSGPVTVIARTVAGRRELWRPFGPERDADCARSIAKSVLGDRLVFEEHHRGWDVVVTATWTPSNSYGWVRRVAVVDGSGQQPELEILDGLLDVMPSGVDAQIAQLRSNLADAYKRSETGPWATLAVYSLESQITDRAEPAESLTATTVWSSGFVRAAIDLDARAVDAMIEGRPASTRSLVTGCPGAYLLRGPVTWSGAGTASWLMVADTRRTHPDVFATARLAADPGAARTVLDDVADGSARLRELLTGADAMQSTGDRIADAHHLSNVLFNSMRGGLFPHGHQVPTTDLAEFLRMRNRAVGERYRTWIDEQDAHLDVSGLRAAAVAADDADLVRLVLEYLPLTFSRRHGDPSRPWNRFSINVRDDDGREVLSYEGNWRDIFQNWEALLQSFPDYIVHVVAKFVNASTLDGHNPYRISRDGVDWEVPDPDDPWSHIGYWGDHQIVYLLRLLEEWQHYEPGAILDWLERPVFAYADVPYEITGYDAMVLDPRNTISFDEQRAEAVARRVESVGADGQLVTDVDGELLRVGLFEKLLVPALAKLSSFVPGGGIWLNTQRPEWNDANNALAGPGLSMVTLLHLRRYLTFLTSRLEEVDTGTLALTSSAAEWFAELLAIFERISRVGGDLDDRARRRIVDALGTAGSAHRERCRGGVDRQTVDVGVADVRRMCALAVEQLDRSIEGARRHDGLFHSYNRISFPTADTARVDHLDLMLEGQVAALSSGALDPEDALALIDALFASTLYRSDQHTFMLYPAVALPPFLERNVVPANAASTIAAVEARAEDSLGRVFATDGTGRRWFRPNVANVDALAALLAESTLTEPDRRTIFEIYEQVFRHETFTGRSGSMYGYEGIGSVYWHMVAKLLLAVEETYWDAVDDGVDGEAVARLADAYDRVRAGLGFRKQPGEYGAFPTDCYSHTPAQAGARQPGMTGQVKEEILARLGELGLRVRGGRISLAPGLLPLSEVVPTTGGEDLGAASFSFCAVPMTIERGDRDRVRVVHPHGTSEDRAELSLTQAQSRAVFARTGAIAGVEWTVGPQVV